MNPLRELRDALRHDPEPKVRGPKPPPRTHGVRIYGNGFRRIQLQLQPSAHDCTYKIPVNVRSVGTLYAGGNALVNSSYTWDPQRGFIVLAHSLPTWMELEADVLLEPGVHVTTSRMRDPWQDRPRFVPPLTYGPKPKHKKGKPCRRW